LTLPGLAACGLRWLVRVFGRSGNELQLETSQLSQAAAAWRDAAQQA